MRYLLLLIYSILFYSFLYFIEHKRFESKNEKYLFIILEIVFICVTFLAVLDANNDLTAIPFVKNLRLDFWANFAITMCSTIVSSLAVLIIGFYQIKDQRDNYMDDKRIQNKPFLLYDFQNKKIDNSKECRISIDGKIYCLWLKVTNISLNHLKNFKIRINDGNSQSFKEFHLDSQQSVIKKDDSRSFEFWLSYNYDQNCDDNNKRIITIEVYYDDILGNHYVQNILLPITVTNIYSPESYGPLLIINDLDTIVYTEELIKK